MRWRSTKDTSAVFTCIYNVPLHSPTHPRLRRLSNFGWVTHRESIVEVSVCSSSAVGTVGVDMNVFGMRPVAPMPARGIRHTHYTSGFVAALLIGASSAASADCTPQSADGVTATCTGTTLNQGGGAPGTSTDSYGYGTLVESGITVNVAAGAANTVTGTDNGIAVGDGTVTNGAGASITGGSYGVLANVGAIDVTNSGSIAGTAGSGIFARTSATVTNNAGASITGGSFGIVANTGAANVTNSGSITGTSDTGIYADANVTVTNNAGASITGGNGIHSQSGAANVTNSGSITGTSDRGIFAATDATVINNAGASITSAYTGIVAFSGAANVTNSGSITSTSDIGIYGDFGSTVTNNAGASISGGTYGIVVANGSSVFNAGSISGGFAAIQFSGTGNTLTLAPGSAITGNVLGTGNDTFQLGGSGAASFDVSQLGDAAQYQGFGSFNKIGSSTWTLIGTSTFTGPVSVDAGTLSVNGDISSASGVTVNAGGTLAGNGIVGTTTINGGTLAPGNSIGLLTVRGNLAFTAASSYMVEVSPSNADRVNVTGTAILGGAAVNASFAPGTYVTRQYTIVNATGGVIGTFGSQVNTNLPANFTSKLSYDANNAYLNLTLDYVPPTPVDPTPATPTSPVYRPLNANQQNVGNSLVGFFNRTGGIPLAFGALTPAGLSQVSGEVATGAQQTTFDAMNLFMGVLTDPFISGRGDSALPGAGATAFAADDGRANAYAMFTKAQSARDAHWTMWATGFGGSQTTDGSAAVGSNAATSRIYGMAVGADYWFSPLTVAGFSLAGGGTNFSVEGGTGRSDLVQAGAFVRHTVGSAYIAAAAAYGWQEITTDRYVTVAGIDHLRANFNANSYSGRIEGGNRFVMPWVGGIGLTPYAAAQVTAFDLPSYAESTVSGANMFALAYAGKTTTATRTELGLRSDKSFALSDAILTLRGRAAWVHGLNTDRSVAATFQTLPGASFVVNGAAQAANAALTTASVEMKWMNGWSVAGTFEGEFSEVTRSYAGKGVVRYAW